MNEMPEKRQENSKRFRVDSKTRQLRVSMGAVHYKDDYASDEPWKDIDLNWDGNKITKAPYELTRDDKKLTIRNKKTNEVSTIELTSIFPPGLKLEVLSERGAVRFRHILPNDKIPFEAKFSVAGKGIIKTKAFDDDGEIVLDTETIGDVITEKLNEVRDKQTGKIRPAKGNISIDPTWQVAASTDDCRRILTTDYWSLATAYSAAGAFPVSSYQWGSGMRFTNITITHGATIDSAYLTLRAYNSSSTTVCNTRISAEDVDNAPTFADDADAFDARWANRTTARVDWDGIGAWTKDTDYDSPEIKTVIQEIVDRDGWASGNDIVIFWDDFDDRATTYRQTYSYDDSTSKAPQLVITYTAPPRGWAQK